MAEEEAFRKAAALCAKREMGSYDMRRKLAAWGLDAGESQAVLDRLEREGFIDDERYARMFVRERLRLNKWGRVKIAVALRAKGFGAEVIERALDEIDEREYMEILAEVLKTKTRTLTAASEYERRSRLARFAQSRGFELDLALRALDRMGKDAEDEAG